MLGLVMFAAAVAAATYWNGFEARGQMCHVPAAILERDAAIAAKVNGMES